MFREKKRKGEFPEKSKSKPLHEWKTKLKQIFQKNDLKKKLFSYYGQQKKIPHSS